MHCDKADIVYCEPTDFKIDDNGTFSVPNSTGDYPILKVYEQEEQKNLSLSELQKLVESLAARVEKLERHYTQY